MIALGTALVCMFSVADTASVARENFRTSRTYDGENTKLSHFADAMGMMTTPVKTKT